MTILEESDRFRFIDEMECFLNEHKIVSVKFQRNLYYKGIGSSAGKTPGAKRLTAKTKLHSSYLAFIVYKDKWI
jgi:hypothetical protein